MIVTASEQEDLSSGHVVCGMITYVVSWLHSHMHDLGYQCGRYVGWCLQIIALHWLKAMVGFNQLFGILWNLTILIWHNGLNLIHKLNKKLGMCEKFVYYRFNRFKLRVMTGCFVYNRFKLRLCFRISWSKVDKVKIVKAQIKLKGLHKKDINLFKEDTARARKGNFIELFTAVTVVSVLKRWYDWRIKCSIVWCKLSEIKYVDSLVLLIKLLKLNEKTCFRMSLEDERTPRDKISTKASITSVNNLEDKLGSLLLDKISPGLNFEKKLCSSGALNGIERLGSPKRKRESDEEAHSGGSRKNLKLTDGKYLQVSYTKMAAIQMLYIVNKNHPVEFLTADKVKEIRTIIKALIATEPDSGVEIKVQFCKEQPGGLGYGCANIDTVKWFKNKVAAIQQQAEVEIKMVNEMEPPYIKATVRFDFDESSTLAACVGGAATGSDAKAWCEKFMKRLKRQNKALNVDDWKVLKYKATDRGKDGLILTLKIPLEEGPKLKAMQGVAYYQDGTVRINFPGVRNEGSFFN